MRIDRPCPDAGVIRWVVETCLAETCPGEDEIVDYLVAQTAAEAAASGSPPSDWFLQKLRTVISEELLVTLGRGFADRLRDLCAEEQLELIAQSGGWKQVGF